MKKLCTMVLLGYFLIVQNLSAQYTPHVIKVESQTTGDVYSVYTQVGAENTFVQSNTLANYSTTAQMNAALADKANAADVYTKTQTDTAISNALTGYATTTELNTKANAADVYTKTEADGLLDAKANASDVTALETAVDTNANNIQTNTDNIDAIDDRVTTNESNIATNAANIATLQNNMSANIEDNANKIAALDNKMNTLSEDVRELKRSFNTGMASMAAMTALVPNARATGNTQLSLGTGAYNGHTAVAIGGFHWVNDDVLLNAGVAWGNSSQAVYKAGVTWSW